MSGVTVSGGGFGHWSEAGARKVLIEEATRSMRLATQQIESVWKSRAARARRTGTYIRSIRSTVRTTGTTVTGTVAAGVRYAEFLEKGTGLYGPRNQWIEPKSAKVLRFPAGKEGFRLSGQQRAGKAGESAQFVFARRVRGIRPRRFARDSALIAKPRVLRIFEDGGKRAAARLAH